MVLSPNDVNHVYSSQDEVLDSHDSGSPSNSGTSHTLGSNPATSDRENLLSSASHEVSQTKTTSGDDINSHESEGIGHQVTTTETLRSHRGWVGVRVQPTHGALGCCLTTTGSVWLVTEIPPRACLVWDRGARIRVRLFVQRNKGGVGMLCSTAKGAFWLRLLGGSKKDTRGVFGSAIITAGVGLGLAARGVCLLVWLSKQPMGAFGLTATHKGAFGCPGRVREFSCGDSWETAGKGRVWFVWFKQPGAVGFGCESRVTPHLVFRCDAPIPMTREQIYNEVKHIEIKWGKRKRTNNNASENQEDTRGRSGKIQKQKRNTTEEEEKKLRDNSRELCYMLSGTQKMELKCSLDLAKRHKQVLKTENPGKRIAFLENEHSKSFAKWLHEEVERELAINKESVTETIRWISYVLHATIMKYDAYNINRYTFRTKCHDGKVYQNSGVLDYRLRQIPLFKCDWVNHKSGGLKCDKLSTAQAIVRAASMSACNGLFSVNNVQLCVCELSMKDDGSFAGIILINEEYLSWNYFPSTDNESTDMETTDKRNTYKDCIVDSNSAMSKGKYVPVCKKNKPNVYSHVQVTGSVLGLPNVTTWDEIEKKMGARKSKTYADKAKGKRKVSCGS
ncbi:hypothetical protein Tco_0600544 [Tanacetum coccineum]